MKNYESGFTSCKLHMKQTIAMEKVLDYILEHINEDISAETAATNFNYNQKYFERVFKEYYEMPFHRFVKKIKLRRAAEVLLTNGTLKKSWESYGYASNISFSTAFSKEFGVSPREFIRSFNKIPEMPDRNFFWETKINCEYRPVKQFTLSGNIYEIDGSKDDHIYKMPSAVLDKEGVPSDDTPDKESNAYYGMVLKDSLHGSDKKTAYFFGTVSESDSEVEKSLYHKTVNKEYYAVFSFEAKPTRSENMYMMQGLYRYVFKEWRKLGSKTPNMAGTTFEKYDEARAYLYVPIFEKNLKSEKDTSARGVDVWTAYINEHIKENLTVKGLAQHFYYSEKSFLQIFELYYGLSLKKYILRRRLCLAAEQIRGGADAEEVAIEYRIGSREIFLSEFKNEFGTTPEKAEDLIDQGVDLNRYYEEYKRNIKISFCEKSEFYIFAGPVIENGSTETNDISEFAAYRFLNDFECVKGTSYQGNVRKAAVWYDTGGEASEYMLGPVMESADELLKLYAEYSNLKKRKASQKTFNEQLSRMKMCRVEGGRYAVFKTDTNKDTNRLSETYRMMTRCVFFGWIRENMYRYDGSRITFVEFDHDKLFFYVPVNQ